MGTLRDTAARIRREAAFLRLVLADRRTPRPAKALLAAALAYLLSPVDLIPDWIPVLGVLDDLLIVPLLVWLAFRMVPREVLADCRVKATRNSER